MTLALSMMDTDAQVAARMDRADFAAWLKHVRPAAGCAQPIRLYGQMYRIAVENKTGNWRILSETSTQDMPDGVIYKPCGNRRASVCRHCSKVYQRDAYQIIRSLLVGGKGVPETVATHPAVFPTLTAPSFGPVHTRVVKRHTCADKRACQCRPDPCHARRDADRCPHGQAMTCYARHDESDPWVGTPLCLDCYDHDGQVVWNNQLGELWRRTRITIERVLRRRAVWGYEPDSVKLTYGKAAEFQRRAVVHLHLIVRLDGNNRSDPGAILPPPRGLDAAELAAAIEYAARTVSFTTDPHPAKPDGWVIGWGDQVDVRPITVAASCDITDSMVAAYLAKYATKSTEVTGHTSSRLSGETIDLYADADGTHTERLIDACWRLGQHTDWRGLRRWAHMLGFGGHFLTKSHRHTVTFRLLRDNRTLWRRTQTAGPETNDQAPKQETVLVVNFLQFVGAGWHTTGDAMLAAAAADLARSRSETSIPDAALATVA